MSVDQGASLHQIKQPPIEVLPFCHLFLKECSPEIPGLYNATIQVDSQAPSRFDADNPPRYGSGS